MNFLVKLLQSPFVQKLLFRSLQDLSESGGFRKLSSTKAWSLVPILLGLPHIYMAITNYLFQGVNIDTAMQTFSTGIALMSGAGIAHGLYNKVDRVHAVANEAQPVVKVTETNPLSQLSDEEKAKMIDELLASVKSGIVKNEPGK